ncbi:TrmB family transcriptional regulator [Methanogenium organophilum]|uniref:TrmB family transcriptional regulator n=1 Tax=Methanogenium organophilum TaxID=2199 RepID=A0A9X9T977_METOG|nr:TrmB family transcriptional regulator [Methanogenium organophilum]WAI02141.1 TrmB family transcriptional regulator [Methanogenium organophilum]
MAKNTSNTTMIQEHLKSLGLTKYESLVYIALLQVDGATATEIHEISGVPRASVYPVLDKLSKKQLVNITTTSPKRFAATPPEEAIDSLIARITQDSATVKQELSAIYEERTSMNHAERQETIWSIHGAENIGSRAIEIIRTAESEVAIISGRTTLTKPVQEAIKALGPDIKVEIATVGGRRRDDIPPNAEELIIETIHQPENIGAGKHLPCVIIIDQQRVIAFSGGEADTPSALYSESPGFVSLFTGYWAFVKGQIPISGEKQ